MSRVSGVLRFQRPTRFPHRFVLFFPCLSFAPQTLPTNGSRRSCRVSRSTERLFCFIGRYRTRSVRWRSMRSKRREKLRTKSWSRQFGTTIFPFFYRSESSISIDVLCFTYSFTDPLCFSPPNRPSVVSFTFAQRLGQLSSNRLSLLLSNLHPSPPPLPRPSPVLTPQFSRPTLFAQFFSYARFFDPALRRVTCSFLTSDRNGTPGRNVEFLLVENDKAVIFLTELLYRQSRRFFGSDENCDRCYTLN